MSSSVSIATRCELHVTVARQLDCRYDCNAQGNWRSFNSDVLFFVPILFKSFSIRIIEVTCVFGAVLKVV